MPQVQVGKHIVEVSNSIWGTETVKYDGVLKAKGFSIFGRTHLFIVSEDGDDVTYEVEFRAGLHSPCLPVNRPRIAYAI